MGDGRMEIVTNIREDGALRAQLNALTRLTYGFDFEEWYRAGHWGGRYIPHSLLVDGELVSNVSINIMDCAVDGEPMRLIQLGTVMTHPAHRGKGYCRLLMERVIAEWLPRCDGMYLYPNDTVQQFYPKFGFRPATEYRYRTAGPVRGVGGARPVSPKDAQTWRRFVGAVGCAAPQGRVWVDNPGLALFYANGENVFWLPELEAYAIAERTAEGLMLHQLIAGHPVDAMAAARLLGGGATVRFGFPPEDVSGLVCEPYGEEEISVFAMGEGFHTLERRRLGMPTLSHA